MHTWNAVRYKLTILISMACLALSGGDPGLATEVVDTGQDLCYDDTDEMACPGPGEPFHGQDAQYDGNQPSYVTSGDGLTVDDVNTGLTWQQAPDTDGDGDVDSDDKLTWVEWQAHPAALNAQTFGGYDDWRLPTIKEIYSLIDFRGIDPSGYEGGTSGLVPFIDTDFFAFAYGDESAGERIIDAQYWSNTQYVGMVFGNQPAVFGVNFADGRIKGYPRDTGPGGTMTQFARCVRGHTDYGMNDFIDNGDGTITDAASGLMWMQDDGGNAYNWAEALDHAETLTYAGHDDWRLPDAKELVGIVDYTRSPSTTSSPAIDPLFNSTSIIDEAGDTNYAFYWTGTTHANWTAAPGQAGAYVAFGEALGYFGPPGMEQWIDVHGAGAQRSDPKSGDPSQWPNGHGPQGDAIRIFNHVRCVRQADATSLEGGQGEIGAPRRLALVESHPNPFNPTTTILFNLPAEARVLLRVFNAAGEFVATLLDGVAPAGESRVQWQAHEVPSGIYFCSLESGSDRGTLKMVLMK